MNPLNSRDGQVNPLLSVFGVAEFPPHTINLPCFCHDMTVFPGIRQILNLQEILDRCNSGGNNVPGSGRGDSDGRQEQSDGWARVLNGTRWRDVECRAYSFGGDLLEGMAVAQQVGRLGSSCQGAGGEEGHK